ncbi:relaxase/mobilization nuclease domain-containing protein [Devosia sp.]|uniref:relaxase/mobilization nuclease domain-containing protein n=1 Tax=Devosia sp. TaxID=1871048 RepID=UPI0019DD16CC|nr:relaxase/mobilization nuclease domain-containing protein [Devosia sp.]MBE0580155.1 relaxase/mobilization nuclease domain-containing protein [Devosia sp.]
MIGKVKNLPTGADLKRLAAYLRGTASERVAGSFSMHLSSDDPAEILDLMEAQAGLSRRAKKPILHLSVSYSPTDKVTPAQMQADAERILVELEMREHQAFAVIHEDKKYPHFHLVVNRVDANGRCVSDSNSKLKIEKVLRAIEAERGLQPVPGRLAKAPGRERFSGPKAAQRGYVQPPAAVIEAMQTARSRDELDARLASVGWELEAAPPRPGQKAGGLILRGPRGERSKASACGRNCSGPALARRFSTPAVNRPPKISAAEAVPQPTPKPSGAHALATALRKARAKPKMPRIAPRVSASGAIARVIRLTLPTPKF